jgi:hypothetical protein
MIQSNVNDFPIFRERIDSNLTVQREFMIEAGEEPCDRGNVFLQKWPMICSEEECVGH